MAFIQDTMDRIDAAVASNTQTVFGALHGEVGPVIAGAGVLGVAWIGVSGLLSARPAPVSAYALWILRYAVIAGVVLAWEFFEPVYHILTTVPAGIGGTMLGQPGDTVWGKADGILDIFSRSDDECGLVSGSFGACIRDLIGFVVYVVFAIAIILIVGGAKIGLAFAIGLAPVFVACAMFRATGTLFATWSKWTLGFALTPMLAVGLAGLVIGLTDAGDADARPPGMRRSGLAGSADPGGDGADRRVPGRAGAVDGGRTVGLDRRLGHRACRAGARLGRGRGALRRRHRGLAHPHRRRGGGLGHRRGPHRLRGRRQLCPRHDGGPGRPARDPAHDDGRPRRAARRLRAHHRAGRAHGGLAGNGTPCRRPAARRPRRGRPGASACPRPNRCATRNGPRMDCRLAEGGRRTHRRDRIPRTGRTRRTGNRCPRGSGPAPAPRAVVTPPLAAVPAARAVPAEAAALPSPPRRRRARPGLQP